MSAVKFHVPCDCWKRKNEELEHHGIELPISLGPNGELCLNCRPMPQVLVAMHFCPFCAKVLATIDEEKV